MSTYTSLRRPDDEFEEEDSFEGFPEAVIAECTEKARRSLCKLNEEITKVSNSEIDVYVEHDDKQNSSAEDIDDFFKFSEGDVPEHEFEQDNASPIECPDGEAHSNSNTTFEDLPDEENTAEHFPHSTLEKPSQAIDAESSGHHSITARKKKRNSGQQRKRNKVNPQKDETKPQRQNRRTKRKTNSGGPKTQDVMQLEAEKPIEDVSVEGDTETQLTNITSCPPPKENDHDYPSPQEPPETEEDALPDIPPTICTAKPRPVADEGTNKTGKGSVKHYSLRKKELKSYKTSRTAESINRHSIEKQPIASTKGRKKCKQMGCNRILKSSWSLKVHVLRMHHKAGHFGCYQCGKVLSSKTGLKLHELIHKFHEQRTHHKATPFYCRRVGCGKMLSSESGLKMHARIHKKERRPTYSCPLKFCNKSFRFPGDLRQHYMNHNAPFKRTSKCTESLQCCICQRLFSHPFNLRAHWRFDCNKRCEQCYKVLASAPALRKHMETMHAKDSAEKLHCSKCDFTTTYPLGLRRHAKHCLTNPHLGIKDGDTPLSNVELASTSKLTCHLCGKHFAGQSYLASHLRSERLRRCEQCGKCFASPYSRFRHEKLMHNRESVSCVTTAQSTPTAASVTLPNAAENNSR